MKERTEAFATLVGQGAIGLDKTLKDRTDAFAALVGQSAIGIDTVMKERTKLLAASITEESAALDKTLKERTEAFVTTVGHGALGLDKLLKDRTQAFAATIGQEATALDKSLKDRTEQLTTFIGQGSAVLDKTLKERTEALASTIGFGAAAIDKSLKDRIALLATSIGEGTQALDRTLQGHGEAFNAALTHQAAMLGQSLKDRTEAFASAINQGAISLDRTLADRSEAFTSSLAQRSKAVELAIGQHTAAMDKQLADRTQMVTESLTERLQLIDSTFGQRAGEIDRVLAEHARTVEATFGRQAAHLNELLANNSVMIRQTAEQVGAQSTEAIGVLTAQTQALRDVSSGLLEQIHNLTQRFENQGQAILTAAKALDSSNTKIDSILENRHQAIIGLLARGQHQGRGPRQHDAVLCRHGGEHADHRREPRQADRLRARPRHRRPGAAGALPDRALARRGASPHRARGRRPQIELRDRHHPDRTPARADARAIRQRFARHARRGTEDRDRSRLHAAGDAAPHGRPAAADGAGHGRHPQGARRSAEGDRGDHSGADAAADPAEPGAGALPPAANYAAAGAAAGLRIRGAPIRSADPRGRPVGGDADLSALAQQVSGASRGPAGGEPQRGYQQGPAEYRQPERRGAGWSVGDLLTNADAPGYPPQRPDPYAPRAPQAQQGGNQGLRLDEIARAIDHRTAAEVWQRFRAGERGVLGRHLYSLDGQATFDEISRRYDRDGDFRATVDRYIGDFERLLREAEQNDPEGRVMQNYMTSETGRVYLLLAHASGRLR